MVHYSTGIAALHMAIPASRLYFTGFAPDPYNIYCVYYRSPHSFYALHHTWTCRIHVRKQERSKVTRLFMSRNLLHAPRRKCARMHLYSITYDGLICVVEHGLYVHGVSIISILKRNLESNLILSDFLILHSYIIIIYWNLKLCVIEKHSSILFAISLRL